MRRAIVVLESSNFSMNGRAATRARHASDFWAAADSWVSRLCSSRSIAAVSCVLLRK